MKVLICDPIHETAIKFLQDKGIDAVNKPDIDQSQLLKEVSQYQALIVRSRTKVTKEVITAGKNLQIICRVGAGLDNIDRETADYKKIKIINAVGANAQAVAELTIGLILTLFRKINLADASMHKGEWKKKELKGLELNGKILGIIGYGNIGKRVANLAMAFGAGIKHHDKDDEENNLNDLLKTSDIISLHMNLNDKTKAFINEKKLSVMKKSAFLINCARAEIIDEDALYNALKNKKLAGAALDVHWTEPLDSKNRWTTLQNVVLTPHIAGQTFEASYKASMMIAEDLVKFKDNL